MTLAIIYSIAILLIGIFIFSISSMNRRYLSEKQYSKLHNDGPMVSVIIPARNEEDNIIAVLTSLNEQSYKNYEVLVINDSSTDNTWNLITDFIKDKDRFRAFQSDPTIKKGRNGKIGALKQLVPHTNGEIIIATDADTVHNVKSISFAVSILLEQNLDMFSGLPEVSVPSFMGELVLSAMNIASTMYLPLPIIKNHQATLFTIANGQYVVMKKQSLIDVGGYEVIENEICDDVKLARAFVKNKKRYQLHRVSDFVSCDMYDSFKASFNGIARSLAGIFPVKLWVVFPLLIIISVLFLIAVSPILSIFYFAYGGGPNLYFFLLSTGWILITISWVRIARLQNFSFISSIFWPITLILTIAMYLTTFIKGLFGKSFSWKGRDLK